MRSFWRFVGLEVRRNVVSWRGAVFLLIAVAGALSATTQIIMYRASAPLDFNAWDVFFSMFGIMYFFPAFLLPLGLMVVLGDTMVRDISSRYVHVVELTLPRTWHFTAAKVVSILITVACLMVVVWIASLAVALLRGFPVTPVEISEFGLAPNGWTLANSAYPPYNAFASQAPVLSKHAQLALYLTLVHSSFLIFVIGLTVRAQSRYLPLGVAFALLSLQYTTALGTEGWVFEYSTLTMFNDSSHRPFALAGAGDTFSSPAVPWSASLLLAGGLLLIGLVALYLGDPTLPHNRRRERARDRKVLGSCVSNE